MTSKIQRVELSCYRVPIHCPFCGQEVIKQPECECGCECENSDFIAPCPHTLFIATDEGGFEHRSAAFDAAMGVKHEEENEELAEEELADEEDESADDEDVDEEEDEDEDDEDMESPDAFTDRVDLPNAIKFAIYVPAPSGMGLYVGFAPSQE
ncbi:MAG TPA: hypothetical protein PKG77_19465 [Phycisphaerae bacterium]|nr:hypothetical protein [Phycisphaerae bacterium]